jgi:RND family efflux transporter MFP subunit
LLAAVGCQPPNELVPPPPPPVMVAKPLTHSVTSYLEETGTTEVTDFVEVRARVKGFLKKIHFQPGQIVEQGQLLYEIEPELYEAKLNQAVASKDVAIAQHLNAKAQYERGLALFEKSPGAIAKEEVEERRAAMEVAKAEIAAADSAIQEAQLNLEYTKVTAPISGRVGKTLVYEGNLVGDGQATHLTTIVKYDPIFASFTISESALLRILDEAPSDEEARTRARAKKAIYLRRDNDENFPFQGRIDYADLAVDRSTGTYAVRGEFPNPDLRILPGLFVRVRVPIETRDGALMLPQRATGLDRIGPYVMVVNGENVVERRDVTLGTKLDTLVVVESGLTADDKVIIEGLQRARPDSAVNPTSTTIEPPKRDVVVEQQNTVPPLPSGPMPDDGTSPESATTPPSQ